MSVTTFSGILIYGGCVPRPVPGFMLIYHEEDPDVGYGSSDMPSNLSDFNESLKCKLLMLR